MIIGHIYINGQIGTYNDVKGVELQDIILQVESQKEAEGFHVHINSPGGDVDTGRLIASYISKLENTITIAENMCGSIATEIHLSVPVQNRKIIEGSKYFIHNPFINEVTGNAKQLNIAADHVKKYEKEILSMYVSKTTADKASLEGLMEAETSLTDEQAKTLGFVSEVLPKTELKAVAFYKEKVNKTIDINKELKDMKTSLITEIKGIVKAAFTPEGDKKVKGAMVVTDNGELSYASEGALPEVGEVVSIGEEFAPEGDYPLTDGTVIKVGAEGLVSEIVVVEEEETVEALKAKIEAMETSHKEKEEEMLATFKTEVEEKVNEVKALVGSSFKIKAEKKVFNKKKTEAPKETMKEKVEARRKELADKKA